MAENLQDNNANQQKSEMPQYPPRNRRKSGGSNWWIPLVIILAVVVLFIVLIGTIVGALGSFVQSSEVEVKSKTVLYLNLADGLPENPPTNPFALFMGSGKQPNFFEVINAIKKAKNDENIEGIYYEAYPASIGMAKANELQKALIEFKESGKFIYSYIEAGAEEQYFNALVSDSIFMPKEGLLEMNGYGSSSLFFDGFFEKIGVDYYVQQFKDFKSAGEMFNRKGYSDSAKHQTRVLLKQRQNHLISHITKHRNLDEKEIEKMLNEGYIMAEDFKKMRLIDAFATEMQVKSFIKAKVNGHDYSFDYKNYSAGNSEDSTNSEDDKVTFLSIKNYIASGPPSEREIFDENTRIAVIVGQGAIMAGRQGGNGGFQANDGIYSEDFIEHIKKAREDEDIKAIVLRIDSPGGSVIASEEIWDEIMRAKQVKPVYASMSNVAASGGYYISAPCDTILADPETITGSIGVILAIPNFAGTLDKLDITVDTVMVSDAAIFINPLLPFTDNSKQKLENMASGIYDRFIEKVAVGRGMEVDKIYELAKGRVWSGKDAHERGLVDVLGGIEDAIDLAKSRIGVPEGKKVYIEMYPKPEDELESILKAFGLSDDADVESAGLQLPSMNQQVLNQILNNAPKELRNSLEYAMQVANMSQKENVLVTMPYSLNIK